MRSYSHGVTPGHSSAIEDQPIKRIRKDGFLAKNPPSVITPYRAVIANPHPFRPSADGSPAGGSQANCGVADLEKTGEDGLSPPQASKGLEK